jgi:adenine phosphoribosyltransferase
MSLELLKQSLLEAPVVKKKDYWYVVHPITDGVPEINPALLSEIANEMYKRIKECGEIDKIVTIEAMGIPIATALSQKMNLPFNIIRKRSYGLTGEVNIKQVTGYSKSELFINGLKKGDKIVIVDDVLSTGGTLKAVVSKINEIDVDIKGVFIAINKGDIVKNILKNFKIDLNILVTIKVEDGKVRIIS